MQISILLFARAKELAGVPMAEVNLADTACVADVKDAVLEKYPQLGGIAASLLWAVNNEYAPMDRQILEADSIACFPPVSGG